MTLVLLTKDEKLKKASSNKGVKVTEILSYFSRVFSCTGQNDIDERMGDEAKSILEHYGDDLIVLGKHDAQDLIKNIERNKCKNGCESAYEQLKSQLDYYKELK